MPKQFQWFGISAIVVALDLFTKHLVQQAFEYGEHLTINRFFDLVRYHNEGAAFSFLANAGGWQKWFFTGISIVAVVVITYLILKNLHNKLFCLGLALVLGGAIGNLIDRFVHGAVVDFIDIYYQQFHWPAFNVADSAITLGTFLLIVDELIRVIKRR